ncbi:protein kinase domain-containing protein [Rhodococcus aetherivorans]
MNVGEMFGPYELRAPLGQGGMGQVWRAHDTPLAREVAIKVLAPELAADPTYRQRFLREARAVARLQHPNIVHVYAFDELDGRLFIAMPLLAGRDLGTVLHEDGPLDPSEAVQIIQQVAEALAAAHQAGVVHRDIKPTNIFVQPGGHVYLIDFGIAHADSDESLTNGTHPIGTAAYMAPERYDGQAGPEVDIYALTCVLFECLTGRRPFEGSSIAQQVAAHLTKPPPRPTDVDSNLPAAFDDIVARGMAKDPAHRYPTVAAFARALPSPTGDTSAFLELGRLLIEKDPPDLEGARHWFEKAATAGNVDAMCTLATLVYIMSNDVTMAHYWIENARDQLAEDEYAGTRLSSRDVLKTVLDGLSDLHREQLAFELALRSDGEAMYHYALALVDDDGPSARLWLETAAKHGYVYDSGELERLLAGLDAKAPVVPGIDAIREVWPNVCAHIRGRSRTTHVMLSGATVHAVEDTRVVLAHDSLPLAKRLGDPRFSQWITEAFHAVLGIEFDISCICTTPRPGGGVSALQRFDSPGKEPALNAGPILSVENVRSRWSEVREQVRQRSRTVEVMLTRADVASMEGNRVVLTVDSAPLRKRLREPRNSCVVEDALFEVFGIKIELILGEDSHSAL